MKRTRTKAWRKTPKPNRRKRRALARQLQAQKTHRDACYVGGIVSKEGVASQNLIRWALQALADSGDRAGFAPDGTPDGCGIMIAPPHELLKNCNGGPPLEAGSYGVAVVMLQNDSDAAHTSRMIINGVLNQKGLRVQQWVPVKVNRDALEEPVRDSFPIVECVVYIPEPPHSQPEAFDRVQYEALQIATHALRDRSLNTYIASMSQRTFVLKGRIRCEKVGEVFPWLLREEVTSSFALIHSRMATGVAASDDRAHPKRVTTHNGELTVDVLVGWCETQQGVLTRGGVDERIFPLIVQGMGDTAAYDDLLNYLLYAGWDLASAIRLTMQPERARVEKMKADHRRLMQNARLGMPQVQGPATIVASNGLQLVVSRDQDGLRPANVWTVDAGGGSYLCIGSEKFQIPGEANLDFQRLEPGEMIVFDLNSKSLYGTSEVLDGALAKGHVWNDAEKLTVAVDADIPVSASPADLVFRQRASGWSEEDIGLLLVMCKKGGAPMTSMGNTSRFPAFSKGRRHSALLKHQHAQMTRPAKDSKREGDGVDLQIDVGAAPVMSLDTVRFQKFKHAKGRQLLLRSPVLSGAELHALRQSSTVDMVSVDATLPADGTQDLEARLDELCTMACSAVTSHGRGDRPVVFLVTDELMSRTRAALPTSMVVGALDNALKNAGLRRECSIIASDSSPAEAHVVAIHLAIGGSAVHFRVAEETIREDPESIGVKDVKLALRLFYQAMDATFIDTISKMGVSRSMAYFGSKLIYGNGIGKDVVARCYPGIENPISGLTFGDVREVQLRFHASALAAQAEADKWTGANPYGSQVSKRPWWAKPVNRNLFGPDTPKDGSEEETTTFSRKIAHATYKVASAKNLEDSLRALEELVTLVTAARTDLTNAIRIKYPKKGIAREEVESAISVAQKVIEAASMSWGALSGVAFETIHQAFNRLGCRSAAGEGGQPIRYVGTNNFAKIVQFAGAAWGFTPYYVWHSSESQIKEAQGAKPGEGGELQGKKNTGEVPVVRNVEQAGIPLPSPAPIHRLYSIEDRVSWRKAILQFAPHLRLSEKVVAAPGLAECLAGAVHLGFDGAVVSGEQGGTGAGKAEAQKHCGWHWLIGLAQGQQRLCRAGYRDHIRLVVDGDIRIPRQAVIALLMGADGVGLGSSLLAAVGCVAERWCQDASCGVGVTSHQPSLVAKFRGLVDHVVNFVLTFAEGIRTEMAALGFRTVEEMIGRVDLLETETDFSSWPDQGGFAHRLDLSQLLRVPEGTGPRYNKLERNPFRPVNVNRIDAAVLADERVKKILETGSGRVVLDNLPELTPKDVAVGTAIAGEIVKHFGKEGLKDGEIVLKLRGVPGLALGTFAVRGLTIELDGLPPDYVGNHMDGGKLVFRRPSNLKAGRRIVIGNVSGFGSVTGEVYLQGDGDSRFLVRNSGLHAVCLSAGHNACSFMTRGRAVFLDGAGNNFCNDMTGGKVWVRDTRDLDQFIGRSVAGKTTVSWRRMNPDDDRSELQGMIQAYVDATGCELGRQVLDTLEERIAEFWVVVPLPVEPPQMELGRRELVQLRPTELVEAN